MSITRQLAAVQQRMTAACDRVGRRADEIRLIAVTKSQAPAVLAPLAAAGQFDFGENRLDHLDLMRAEAPDGARFHYIGRIQSRQLPKVAARCTALHSLAQHDHIDRLGRACAERDQPFPVFLQVNAAGEAQKAGLTAEALPAAIERVAAHSGLRLLGLMTMAPDRDLPEVGDDTVRRCFAAVRELAVAHGLPRLSMGMSGDFELAIEEGATDLRVGSVLFE